MEGRWRRCASPGLQLKYSETFLQLPSTTSPSECHSAVSNFKTELISLRAEPYYVIYRLYPPGRLSGGWLADAVLQFLPLSSALKGSESEGQPERRAAVPQGWSQRAQCRPASGTHSGQTSEVWQRCTIIPELLMPGNRLGERRQPEKEGALPQRVWESANWNGLKLWVSSFIGWTRYISMLISDRIWGKKKTLHQLHPLCLCQFLFTGIYKLCLRNFGIIIESEQMSAGSHQSLFR